MESWSGAIEWHVGVAFLGGFKFLLPIPLFIKFTVYARDNINLGNSESFCKIILLIFVIFELRHKNLLFSLFIYKNQRCTSACRLIST